MARREKHRVLVFLNCLRSLTWLRPKMVLMGGRVSGYAIAGMWRSEGPNHSRSDVAHLQSEASETKPYGVRDLLVPDGAWPFWVTVEL
jgi:hypothetical protein